jgi:hypothetical protein
MYKSNNLIIMKIEMSRKYFVINKYRFDKKKRHYVCFTTQFDLQYLGLKPQLACHKYNS